MLFAHTIGSFIRSIGIARKEILLEKWCVQNSWEVKQVWNYDFLDWFQKWCRDKVHFRNSKQTWYSASNISFWKKNKSITDFQKIRNVIGYL